MPKKKRRKITYFTRHGRIESAYHPRLGTVVPGDRVECTLTAGTVAGTVLYLTRCKFGTGRPYACVRWDTGYETMGPLGLFRRPKPAT